MKKAGLILVAVALAALLVLGVVSLLDMRIRHGDVYPAYSSLRGDPLGTKVLYDALADIVGTERHLRGLERLPDNMAQTTLLFLGVPARKFWLAADQQKLESVAHQGGRVVLTFVTENETGKDRAERLERARKIDRRFQRDDPQKEEKKQEDAGPADKKDAEESAAISSGTFAGNWGVGLKWRETKLETEVAGFSLGGGKQTAVPWHSTLYFDPVTPQWKVIASAEGKPVVIERTFGDGTLVLATDSFFLSNEAMRTDRVPEVLDWCIGKSNRVIFDEAHLSIRMNPGIVSLARKYRLDGLGIVLALAMGLFAWRSATSLVPALPTTQLEASPMLGRDAASGYINLLRRNIPPRELLRVCVEQWKRSLHHPPRLETAKRIEEVTGAARSNPVEAYRTISKILSERKL